MNTDSSLPPGLVLVVDDGGAPRDEVDDMLDEFAKEIGAEISRAPIVACDACHHLSCVCQTLADHVQGCRFRLAVTCAIPISCVPHGLDVCAACGDVCTCDEVKKAKETP
jgi:hypothetical protein